METPAPGFAVDALRWAGVGTWRRDLRSGEVVYDERCRLLFGFTGTVGATPFPLARSVPQPDLSRIVNVGHRILNGELVGEEGMELTVGRGRSARRLAVRARVVVDDEGRPLHVEGAVWVVAGPTPEQAGDPRSAASEVDRPRDPDRFAAAAAAHEARREDLYDRLAHRIATGAYTSIAALAEEHRFEMVSLGLLRPSTASALRRFQQVLAAEVYGGRIPEELLPAKVRSGRAKGHRPRSEP